MVLNSGNVENDMAAAAVVKKEKNIRGGGIKKYIFMSFGTFCAV